MIKRRLTLELEARELYAEEQCFSRYDEYRV